MLCTKETMAVVFDFILISVIYTIAESHPAGSELLKSAKRSVHHRDRLPMMGFAVLDGDARERLTVSVAAMRQCSTRQKGRNFNNDTTCKVLGRLNWMGNRISCFQGWLTDTDCIGRCHQAIGDLMLSL